MTKELLNPDQLELASAHLMPWLGARSLVTIEEAVAGTRANMDAAGVSQAERAGATAQAISTILKIRGFIPVEAAIGTGTAYVRRGSLSETRLQGLAYARAWRERNRPHFAALYPEGAEA